MLLVLQRLEGHRISHSSGAIPLLASGQSLVMLMNELSEVCVLHLSRRTPSPSVSEMTSGTRAETEDGFDYGSREPP